MASSLSSTLRLFSPKLSLKPATPNPVFLSPKPPFLFSSSPISFQRLSSPSAPKSHSPQHPPHVTADVDPSLLPPKLLEIVRLFQSVPDPKAKYQQLLHYAAQLPPMGAEFKTESNRVRGCVSQVWVRAYLDPAEPGAVRFEADSDAVITRGLAALLVLGLSGSDPLAVARVPPAFVQLLGLRQSLTPSRNNGFLNMLQLMQRKALELHSRGSEGSFSDEKSSAFDENSASDDEVVERQDSILADKVDGFGENSMSNDVSGQKDPILREDIIAFSGNSKVKEALVANGSQVLEKDLSLDHEGYRSTAGPRANGDVRGEVASISGGGRAERIRERLERELVPVELDVEDISYQHAGHAAVRGSGDGETHFNVRVVSKEFEGKSMVKRHRLVYNLLQEELQSGLHALSIDAKTPEEVRSS